MTNFELVTRRSDLRREPWGATAPFFHAGNLVDPSRSVDIGSRPRNPYPTSPESLSRKSPTSPESPRDPSRSVDIGSRPRNPRPRNPPRNPPTTPVPPAVLPLLTSDKLQQVGSVGERERVEFLEPVEPECPATIWIGGTFPRDAPGGDTRGENVRIEVVEICLGLCEFKVDWHGNGRWLTPHCFEACRANRSNCKVPVPVTWEVEDVRMAIQIGK